MACRPVVVFTTFEFWAGVAAGAILTFLAGRFLGLF